MPQLNVLLSVVDGVVALSLFRENQNIKFGSIFLVMFIVSEAMEKTLVIILCGIGHGQVLITSPIIISF